MKALMFVAVLVFIVSCKKVERNNLETNRDITYETKIVIIDGCEYIEHDGYEEYALMHKGNCSNHQ